MEYLDFELEIDLATEGEYPVSVVRSPAGEARATMVFPFDALTLGNHLQALESALLRSASEPSSAQQPALPAGPAVSDFGKALFNALLPGGIRSRYVASKVNAMSQGKGLRLKLRVRPPELAALPWEFLYDPDEDDFICLSRSTPIVRYIEMPQSAQALKISPPLRVLGMVASPSDMPALDTARERQRVEEALKGLMADGRVELKWLEGQTWRHLSEAMWSGEWHVFHFIGHGGFDTKTKTGQLVLADETGKAHRMTANQIARLLNDHEPLRLVLLNSCDGARAGDQDIFSSSAATLIRRGIPAVLAMQYEITDEAAIEFARTFYHATAFGMPVDAAVAEARRAILIGLDNSLEWGTPVLYMRSGDGVLFDLQSAPAPPAPPPLPPDDPVVDPEPVPDDPEGPQPLVDVTPTPAPDEVEPDPEPTPEPVPAIAIALTPPARRSWLERMQSSATYTAIVSNPGTEPVRVNLEGYARDNGCVVTVPEDITVPGGKEVRVPVSVRPKNRRFFGGSKRRRFTVAGGSDGPNLPTAAQGEFDDNASPLGLLGIALAAVLIGMFGLAFAFWPDDDAADSGDDEDEAAEETAVPGDSTGTLAFTSYRDGIESVYQVRSDRSNETLLTPEGWNAVQGAWSPDGSTLAFASNVGGNYDIFVMRPGEEPIPVTDDPAEDSDPAWSPDGTQIAFWTARNDPDGDIYVVDIASGRTTPFAVQPGYDEMGGWSPDGQYFVFISEGTNDSREIFVADADGDNPTQITFFETRARWPVFSPDSELIAFATDVDGDWEVYVTTIDGNDMSRLTYDEGFDGQPDWAPSGTAIVYASEREGGSVACPPRYPGPCADRELYLVDEDGNEPVRLYGTPAFESEPAWRPDPE